MWNRWKRQRQLAKAEPGDGSTLKAHRPWQVLSRSVFQIDLPDDDGVQHAYCVDVDYFDLDDKVRFYRDGRQHLVAEQPAAFAVPGGAVEVAVGTFGVSRMHLVSDAGEPERVLRPIRHSGEYWRAVLDHRHPRLSRWIGRVAIVILLVGLVLFVPQLLELITGLDVVAERVGTFTSPISLPAWLNTTLLVAGIAASLERGLTLRSHWLIDMDTWWLG
ncbi:hypothetical protein [Ornithinimicrobium faecis]|uniref:Uncharacterized protein n=1 Tax=Ornithinimicrobium faecis TaxID=2934158 RepID=A0ABY4YW22_9MICO|nr:MULTISPECIES: hypothetical protein [unclassified Ornithinimicrobium]USQ80935.1 hypothetical protein NF556_04605 [Ornithinimicrobium sp. HY1793]